MRRFPLLKLALATALFGAPFAALAQQPAIMVPGIEYNAIGPDGTGFVAIFADNGKLLRRTLDERVKSDDTEWQMSGEELCIRFTGPSQRVTCSPEREFGDGGFRFFDGGEVFEFSIRERTLLSDKGGMVPGTTYRGESASGPFELAFGKDGDATLALDGRDPLDYVNIWYRSDDQLCLEDNEMMETMCLGEGPAQADGSFVLTIQGEDVVMHPK